MLGFSFMPQVKVPVVNRIHPHRKFATDLENKAPGDSKLSDSRDIYLFLITLFHMYPTTDVQQTTGDDVDTVYSHV